MLTLILVVSLLLPATAGDQQRTPEPTLLEVARKHGGVHTMTDADGPFVRLADIVSKADVIVYGTVVGVEARLSGDQRHVLTDYQVHSFTTLYDGVKHEAGVPQTPVFTARGGTLVVEGLTISEGVAHNGSFVTLSVGDEVVVMGKLEKQMLMLSSVSVFTVVDGAVKAKGTVEGFTDEGPGVPLDQFMTRVLTLSAHN